MAGPATPVMIDPRKSLLIAGLLVGGTVARADSTPSWLDNLHLSASATTEWTENISRTSYEPTRKDAASYDLSLGATQPRQLAPDWLLTFGAGAEFIGVPAFEKTDNFNLGPQLGLQRKFGLGPLAPVLQFNTSYTYKAARYAPDRGGSLDASLRLAKRLSPDLKVALSGQWFKHYADSALFTTQQRTISAEVSYDLSERWRLTGSVGRMQGTLVANAAAGVYYSAMAGAFGPAVAQYYSAIPWEETNLYGDEWISYLVEAHADLWSVSLAYAVTDRTTLELHNNSVFVVNEVKVRYPNDSFGLSVIHRF